MALRMSSRLRSNEGRGRRSHSLTPIPADSIRGERFSGGLEQGFSHLGDFFRGGGVGGHEEEDIADGAGEEAVMSGLFADAGTEPGGGIERGSAFKIAHKFDGKDGAFLSDITDFGQGPEGLGDRLEAFVNRGPLGQKVGCFEKIEVGESGATAELISGVAVAVEKGPVHPAAESLKKFFRAERCRHGEVACG